MQARRWNIWISCFLLFFALTALPGTATAQVSIGISVGVAPPALPVYDQPICPAPNYIWTPGYWAWGPYGYYWVPGTWVEPPAVGLLWTPGYWGWGNGAYAFHEGYWGPTVGFYGGVNYGFGYNGSGFYGGRWVGNSFSYNTAVVNVNRTIIRNTYVDRTVIVNRTANRVSYNGGQGGLTARATAAQMQAERGRRFGPVASQTRQASLARDTKVNYYSANHGAPPRAATARPAASAADFNRARPAHGANLAVAQRAAANVRPVGRTGEAAAGGARTPGNPAARTETRPNGTAPGRTTPERATPRTENRPAAPGRSAAPAPSTRNETRRPAATPRETTRPAEPTRPAQPRTETRPESRPATRPAPAPRTETRPETRTAPRPQPRTAEPRPAPQQHTPAPRPAPQEHAAPAPRPHAAPAPKPAPRPAPKSAPRPEEKPR